MAVATDTQVSDKLYIGGEWVDPAGDETIDVVNPSTEEVMGRIPQGTPEDVDRAVAAARKAFETWSQTPLAERANLHARDRGRARGRAPTRSRATIAQELGMPIGLSRAIQAGLPTMTFTSMPDLLEEVDLGGAGRQLADRARAGRRRRLRSRPWNYPLHQIAAKVAPALAAGCTVVLKPSEVAPAQRLHPRRDHRRGRPAGGRLQPRDGHRARSSARRSPPIPASTWSPSPARRAPGGASASWRRRP